MKQLSEHITEALKINSKSKVNTYSYKPKDREELIQLIYKLIQERGDEADLNDIDTSEITDMESVFDDNDVVRSFNGNISKWDVSNVENMSDMFNGSKFNGDISKWDVSNVKNMSWMFTESKFNGDISKWDVSNVKYMVDMFKKSPLEKNLPKWYK